MKKIYLAPNTKIHHLHVESMLAAASPIFKKGTRFGNSIILGDDFVPVAGESHSTPFPDAWQYTIEAVEGNGDDISNI